MFMDIKIILNDASKFPTSDTAIHITHTQIAQRIKREG